MSLLLRISPERCSEKCHVPTLRRRRKTKLLLFNFLPYTGRVLGKGSKLSDWFHEVIDWHRWLGMEGEGRAAGRAITGACNLAFFWLTISGVYLWWPQRWHWRSIKPGLLFNFHLRGKARDWNWHNVIGFWSSAVLVVLTLTAVLMSYPWANDLLYTLTGSEPPPRNQGPGAQAQDQQRRGGGAARKRTPMASFDAFQASAERLSPGWVMMMIRLPPHGDVPVTDSILESSAPHMFARSQLTLNRASAEIVKWAPYANNSTGRKLRSWFRGLHTGEAFSFVGQTVAGLASLGGCFLVWTSFAMAWMTEAIAAPLELPSAPSIRSVPPTQRNHQRVRERSS